MKCAMVILNYKDSQRARKLAEACSEYKCIDKIVVVDNDSQDGSYESLKEIRNEKIEILKAQKNKGFSAGNNVGAKYIYEKYDPQYIFFANTDTFFPEENLIACMTALEENDDLGLVSSKMLGPDGKEQNCFYDFPTYKTYMQGMFWINRKKHYNKVIKERTLEKQLEYVDIVRGSFMFFKMRALQQAGFFDENTFLYCEETIIAERLKRAGYKVGLLTRIHYIHDHWEAKTNPSITATKRLYDSRYYVAVHYWKINGLQKILMKICMKYSIGESWLIDKLKKMRRGNNK